MGVRQLTETTPLEFFSSQRREGQTACHTRTSLAFSSRLWQSMHEQPVQYCLAAKQSQYSLRQPDFLQLQCRRLADFAAAAAEATRQADFKLKAAQQAHAVMKQMQKARVALEVEQTPGHSKQAPHQASCTSLALLG